MDVPTYVKTEFGDFYRAMFDTQTRRENGPVVFVEYAWDMNWCDPCAADPLSEQELRELGVFWLDEAPAAKRIAPRGPGGARDAFVTRLHVRYDAERFPDDLVFQQTGDRSNFQGRYVLRHPWRGESSCEQADVYRRGLPARLEREAQTLASLTDWDIEQIRKKLDLVQPPEESKQWWERLWND
jgi:hypothetical protein